jgi:hypothetical protein
MKRRCPEPVFTLPDPVVLYHEPLDGDVRRTRVLRDDVISELERADVESSAGACRQRLQKA